MVVVEHQLYILVAFVVEKHCVEVAVAEIHYFHRVVALKQRNMKVEHDKPVVVIDEGRA